MNDTIFNPFKYIAGVKSLAAGVFILLTTAAIGFFSNTHFPDLISVKTVPDFPLTYFILQGFSNWLVISIILYLIAIFASPSRIRIVDIFGTQALARFPYLIASFIGFSDSLDKFGKYLLWNAFHTGEETIITTANIIIAVTLLIINLLLTIWLVTLMYNAFKVSANIKGSKSVLLFIVAFILSMLITIFINKLLIHNFS
jgi:hypothetical protein